MNEFLSQVIFKEEAEQEMFVPQNKLLIKQRHKNTSPLQKITTNKQTNKQKHRASANTPSHTGNYNCHNCSHRT